jgi:hypothetical protein
MNQISSPWLVHIDWLLSYHARMPEWRTSERRSMLALNSCKIVQRNWIYLTWHSINYLLLLVLLTSFIFLKTTLPIPALPHLVFYATGCLIISYIGMCSFWNYISVREISRFRAWQDHHSLWWKCVRLPYTGQPDGPLYRTIRLFEPEH